MLNLFPWPFWKNSNDVTGSEVPTLSYHTKIVNRKLNKVINIGTVTLYFGLKLFKCLIVSSKVYLKICKI